MDKIKINQNSSFGTVVVHPELNPEISVTLACDVSNSIMKRMTKINLELQQYQDMASDVEPKAGLVKMLSEIMLEAIVIDWNLYDDNEVKLPINTDTVDNILSLALRNWLLEQVQSFFTKLMTSRS